MKKFIGVLLVTLFLATGSLLLMPNESQAVPAFARQVGQACQACHFAGNYPVLNGFGREFKRTGYTMVGGEGLITGDALSIPAVLNAAVVAKFRYVGANGQGATLDFPDEMALFFGGRVAENIGFMLELPVTGGGAVANFKLPIEFHVGEANLSVVPYTTDGLGPFLGFELLNTGLVDNAKPLERSGSYTTGRFIGTDHAAEGVTLALSKSDIGYLAYTVWRPNHANNQTVHSFSNALRLVLTHQMGSFNVAGGFFAIFGKSTFNDPAADVNTKAWGLDAQIQGELGNGMPLGIYLSYGSASGTNAGDTPNMYNGNPNTRSVFGGVAQLGIIPNKVNISLGGRLGKTGADTNDKNNALVLGASYQFVQNVKLELNYESYSGSANDAANNKNRTTFMIFTAF